MPVALIVQITSASGAVSRHELFAKGAGQLITGAVAGWLPIRTPRQSVHGPSTRPSFALARTNSWVFSGISVTGRQPASVPEAYTDDVQVPFRVFAPTVVLSWNS